MQSMARTLNDILTSVQKLLLFSRKDAPPDNLRRLSICIRRKAMEGSLQEIKRQHMILLFDVFHYLLPMTMIIQFGTQHLKRERKSSLSLICIIFEVDFRTPNLIAIVEKASEQSSSKGKSFIITLAYGTELRTLDMDILLEINPYRIVCVIKEDSRRRHIFQDTF